MKLRDEQLKAIETIDRNLAINAGAGTGKTEVLTRRYVNLLKNGDFGDRGEVSSVVAITFTKKAASEMKQRVRELVENSEDEKLQQLAGDLNDPNISTIDSFCGKIVKENSYFLDIDPSFKVMEDRESYSLLNNTLNELLKSDEYKGIIHEILNKTGRRDSDQVREDIKNIYNAIDQTTERPSYFIKEALKSSEKLNKKSVREDICKSILAFEENSKFADKFRKFLFEEGTLEKLLNEDDDYTLSKYFSHLYGYSSPKYNDLKVTGDLERQYIEYKNMELNIKILKLCDDLKTKMMQEKKKLGRFEFNDILQMSIELMQIPSVKEKIQSDIRYLMVDEYQDSNDLQRKLFYEICSVNNVLDRGNLFIVGDPKQSIYGFRGANINVFSETLEDIVNSGGELINFDMNFRSDRGIIEPVNIIYSKLMEERYNPLSFSKDNGGQRFNIIFGDNKSPKDLETNLISKFIIKSLKEESLGNFTLLFRSRSKISDFENKFKEQGLDYYTFDSPGFFTTEEINLLISILKLIKNEGNNISYYYILNSKLYSYSDEEILEFYKNGNEEIQNAVNEIHEKIVAIKNLNLSSNRRIVEEIYRSFKIFEIYNFENRDFQAQGNLYKMILLSRLSDENLETFDEFFYTMEEKYSTLSQQQVEDEKSDVIKLMTIHGSKGLGFNQVIVPNLGSKTASDKNIINFSKENGIGVNYLGVGYNFNLNKDLKKATEEKENDNIYYVAMTRAKEGLLLGMSGASSGYKSVLDKIVVENFEENFLDEGEYKDVLPIERENNYENPEKNFPYLENLEIEDKKTIKLNISEIMQNYNMKNEVGKVYDNSVNFDLNISSNILGKLVHRFVQIYEGDFEETFQKVKEEFLFDSNEGILRELLLNILDDLDEEYFEGLREINFVYRYKNFIFRGIIDNIVEKDDTIIVTDYKFSSLNNESLIANYFIQIVFYGIVLEKLYPKKEIKLQLINLRNKYKTYVDFNDDIKEKVIDIIEKYDGRKN
ncbi:UvrD-helicase domain-containing protein [Lagierella sp. ICN-221743]